MRGKEMGICSLNIFCDQQDRFAYLIQIAANVKLSEVEGRRGRCAELDSGLHCGIRQKLELDLIVSTSLRLHLSRYKSLLYYSNILDLFFFFNMLALVSLVVLQLYYSLVLSPHRICSLFHLSFRKIST